MGKKLFTPIVLAILFMIMTPSLVMGETSGTLHLQGVVKPRIGISVASQQITLSGDKAALPDTLNLGSLSNSSNTANGYAIYITSKNAQASKSSQPFLAESNDASKEVRYNVMLDGSQMQFSDGTAMVRSINPEGENIPASQSGNLSLSFDDPSQQSGRGNFQDTLTVTVSVK